MKKIILLAFPILFIFSSCEDENTSKVKEIANQFADAVNSNDKATIFEMFPDSKDMPNMSLVENVEVVKFDVIYNDSLKEFEVKYGNKQNQFLTIKKDSSEIMKIIDSYHIFKLDSVTYELALKTGVPVNKISDVHLCDLLRESSGYISGLKRGNILSDILEVESYRLEWDRYGYGNNTSLYAIVKNNSKHTVKGLDYKIEFSLYDKYSNSLITTVFQEGKDIAPNSRERLETPIDGFQEEGAIYSTRMEYRVIIQNLSLNDQLLKYGDWNGGEYDFYTKINNKIDETEKALQEKIEIASIKKLTKDDLKGLLQIDIILLRNSIYAKHGYIFKDKDIRDYFMGKPWYKEKTNDMNKVSVEFNEIEKYNVDFIKEYEKSF